MAKRLKAGAGDKSVADAASAALSEAPSPAAVAAIAAGNRRMFHLSSVACRLLDTAVLVDSRDQSAVIEDLIITHLAGYFSGHTARDEIAPDDIGG